MNNNRETSVSADNFEGEKDSIAETDDEIGRLCELYRLLNQRTIELRSPITALLLHTEGLKSLNKNSRECILRICEVINEKNDELIYSQKLLREVINQLAPEACI